jgi:pimeloyl-ACP methyl ester carboxylesterase
MQTDKTASCGAIALHLATAASLIAALLATAPCRAAQGPAGKVAAALIALQAHADVAKSAMGEDGAADLGLRLANDLENFDGDVPPDGFAAADWNERLNNVAELDSSLVTQVLSGKREQLESAHGLVERVLISRVDGSMQPVALYVPTSAGPHPSLVVLLHGRPQTESEILAGPYFRKLADSTGTIVAAPYGRGIYDFASPADDEVYQTADEMAAAFHVDSHHVFLAGYSMGGFSVFKIGPAHASRWAGVMCISGAVLNSEAASVSSQFRSTPMYVVTGARDQSIPSRYTTLTAEYLAGVGIPTGLYLEQNGTHIIATLMPSLSVAWGDMIRGVVRNTPETTASGISLPATMPGTPMMKP